MTRPPTPNVRYDRLVRWPLLVLVAAAALYGVTLVYSSGGPLMGALLLGGFALIAYVYTSKRTHAYRYLFPGLVGMALFILTPLAFTVWLGFTNYSSQNILTFERATDVLMSRTYELGAERMTFQLHADGSALRLVLRPEGVEDIAPDPEAEDDSIFDNEDDSIFDEDDSIFDDEDNFDEDDSIFDDEDNFDEDDSIFDDEDGFDEDDSIFDDGDGAEGTPGDAGPEDAGATDAGSGPVADDAPPGEDFGSPVAPGGREPAVYVTEPVVLDAAGPLQVSAVPLAESDFEPGEPLSLKEVIARQEALKTLEVRLPSGTDLVKVPQGLTTFAAEAPLYTKNDDGTLTNQQTGVVLTPNFDTGFYQTPDGEPVPPGFRVHVGFGHYVHLFTDPALRAPFLRIFLWTVTFSGLSVLFTLMVGSVLAELLQWDGLRYRSVYRVLLFLPYAVPAFLSILLFKGLFNENIGEFNLILETLFGVKPQWFTDPFLAKVMILIVNTWLGYPYMMLLWMGLRQAIPSDLYEASALAGAGPFTNFMKITWPLVRRPLTPLLVSAFAFNFNNFVLIQLLTNGQPDFLDTALPAGTNDLLVTYTYRIAFEDTGQQFGLAAAISTVVFLLVAALSLINLKLTKVNESQSP